MELATWEKVTKVRVIAGDFRGRRLYAVPGRGTRPTADRVKEAMFSRLGSSFSGGVALDLFAGTGALGIEALSRGCERAVFIDQERQSIAVIRKNLQELGLSQRAEVYRNDAWRALRNLRERQLSFDLVFLDPPYANRQVGSLLAVLVDGRLLSSGAQVVVEHDEEWKLPEQVGGLQLVNRSPYGGTALTHYRYGE